MKIYAHHFEQL